jgi:hypothetical protein
MRAPLISLLICATGLAGAGCASSPPQQDPSTTLERTCSGAASDPLHMASTRTDAARGDPEIEALLTQSNDPRLMSVNRQMYQSLHALDVELRREQRIAACERSQSGSETLQAQAGPGAVVGTDAAGGSVATGNGAGVTRRGTVAIATGSTASAASGAGVVGSSSAAASAGNAGGNGAGGSMNGATVGVASSTLVRKSSLPVSRSGGNGATMQKVVAGSDNDVVARRLRKAAEQETNPALREKLWKEYADYRQGIAAK